DGTERCAQADTVPGGMWVEVADGSTAELHRPAIHLLGAVECMLLEQDLSLPREELRLPGIGKRRGSVEISGTAQRVDGRFDLTSILEHVRQLFEHRAQGHVIRSECRLAQRHGSLRVLQSAVEITSESVRLRAPRVKRAHRGMIGPELMLRDRHRLLE